MLLFFTLRRRCVCRASQWPPADFRRNRRRWVQAGQFRSRRQRPAS